MAAKIIFIFTIIAVLNIFMTATVPIIIQT